MRAMQDCSGGKRKENDETEALEYFQLSYAACDFSSNRNVTLFEIKSLHKERPWPWSNNGQVWVLQGRDTKLARPWNEPVQMPHVKIEDKMYESRGRSGVWLGHKARNAPKQLQIAIMSVLLAYIDPL